jgi:hypothetical protein
MQNLQGKVAGYDYFSALEKLTDNAGMSKIKVRDLRLQLLLQSDSHFALGSIQRVHAHHA